MKRGRWADYPELLRERSRLGVIKATTLEQLGMDSRTIYRRCLPGGPWRRLLPGIILLQDIRPTNDQMTTAALLFAGAEALITGADACRRHGLKARALPPDDGVHVLVPHRHKLLSAEFVTIERTHRMPSPVTRGGIPLAPLTRAVLDAARRLRDDDVIRKLLIEAVQQGRSSLRALSYELENGSQRGTALPRRLLADVAEVRSIAESDAKRLVRRTRLPVPRWNTQLYETNGMYVACPDAYWEDVALAWEIDSAEFHFKHTDYANTLQRNSRYAAAGIVVVQTLPSRLREKPQEVIAELESAYRRSAARPVPPLKLPPTAA